MCSNVEETVNVWTIVPTECRDRRPMSPFSFRVALATVGSGTYPLITPHSGRRGYDKQLERRPVDKGVGGVRGLCARG